MIDYRLNRSIVGGMLLCFSCLGVAATMSTTSSAEPGKPPQVYRLDETTIQITRHPGRSTAGPRRLDISGEGRATLEQDGKEHSFRYPTADLLALLNGLYAIRFLDLPSDYTTRQSITLRADGTIVTSMLRMTDAPSTAVCLSTTGFKKCVSYPSGAHDALEEIVARTFSQAETLSATAGK